MDLTKMIAPVITHWATISAVVGGLVAWALWSGVGLYRKTQVLIRALESAAVLVSTARDSLDFAARYESIAAKLAAIAPLKPRWREFAASLLIPSQPGRPLRASTRPAAWFDLNLLRSREIGVDVRYHAALPNLFVGAGLLFTFLGLAVALSTAGGIVGGDQGQRTDALKGLLDTASFKFITSLAGLALSILYANFRNGRLRRVDLAIEHFVERLEERVPLVTAVELQREANALIERQLTYTESLATDLSLALQQAVDQAFDQRLGEHIGPLRVALESLAARISTGIEDALRDMLESFVSQLHGGADDKLQSVAGSLEGLGRQLDGLQTGLGKAATDMAQSAEAMAARMGEGAEAALTRITDQMAGVVETLRSVAEDTRNSGAEAGRGLAEQIGTAAVGFEAASRGIAETLSRAAEGLEKRMGAEAEASAARLNQQIAQMLGQLQTLAESSRATGGEALQQVANKVADSAAAFEAMAQRISTALNEAAANTGGALGKGAEEAVRRIAEATEGMQREMAALIGELRESAGKAGETLRAGGAEGAGALKDVLDEAGSNVGAALARAAEKIVAAGESASEAVKGGGEEAARSLTAAGGAFGSRADALAAQTQALARASEAVASRLIEFNTAAHEAAKPLTAFSGDLKTASAALREAATPLAGAGKSVVAGIEQMSGAVQRLEAAQTSARNLADSLRGAVERFSGLDKDLSKVFGELQTGLQGFSNEVSRCVRETDNGLAKAVTQLHRLVGELQDLLDK